MQRYFVQVSPQGNTVNLQSVKSMLIKKCSILFKNLIIVLLHFSEYQHIEILISTEVGLILRFLLLA